MSIFKKKEQVPEDERNEKIKSMARFYLSRKKYTYRDVALKFECSNTTVSKYLTKLLPTIDEKLSERVQTKLKEVHTNQTERFKKEVVNKTK